LAENNTVIICGRRESVLKEISDKYPNVITKVCDVSKEEDRVELYQWIATNHPDTNVLINNAGILQWLSVTDADFFQRAKQELATNIEAPIHLSSLFIGLEKLDTIINVTSGLCFVPLASAAVYSATKSFLHSFTLSLQYVLRSRNIEVIDMIPPALNTDLAGKGYQTSSPSVEAFVESIFNQLKEGKTELTFGFSEKMANASPEEIRTTFNHLNPAGK
jgi:uncharacterized oxidoreductase